MSEPAELANKIIMINSAAGSFQPSDSKNWASNTTFAGLHIASFALLADPSKSHKCQLIALFATRTAGHNMRHLGLT